MSAGPTTPAAFICPSCGATNPSTHGFVDWCATCDWNVDPDGLAAAKEPLSQ